MFVCLCGEKLFFRLIGGYVYCFWINFVLEGFICWVGGYFFVGWILGMVFEG